MWKILRDMVNYEITAHPLMMQNTMLQEVGNTPFRLPELDAFYPHNKDLAGLAKRLVDAGKLVRLKKGMYVIDYKVLGGVLNTKLMANHMYGPSYVSMHTAMRYYGLTPEGVYLTSSMTTGPTRSYKNAIGYFDYIHVPSAYYHHGVRLEMDDDGTMVMIASPEKALCDYLIYSGRNLNIRSKKDMGIFLEEDLRFDMDYLVNFDIDILRRCAETGRKKAMINQLIKIVTDEQKRNI